MGSGHVNKTSLLLVVAKVSQPVEVLLMWIKGRFGVHAVASSIHSNAWMRPAIDIDLRARALPGGTKYKDW